MLSLLTASAGFTAPVALRAPVLARTEAPRMEKSQALPFLEKPAHLDGTYAGDVVRWRRLRGCVGSTNGRRGGCACPDVV